MKFDKIKTLKVLEFNILCCLMLMVLSKNLLHSDTPEREGIHRNKNWWHSFVDEKKNQSPSFLFLMNLLLWTCNVDRYCCFDYHWSVLTIRSNYGLNSLYARFSFPFTVTNFDLIKLFLPPHLSCSLVPFSNVTRINEVFCFDLFLFLFILHVYHPHRLQ